MPEIVRSRHSVPPPWWGRWPKAGGGVNLPLGGGGPRSGVGVKEDPPSAPAGHRPLSVTAVTFPHQGGRERPQRDSARTWLGPPLGAMIDGRRGDSRRSPHPIPGP